MGVANSHLGEQLVDASTTSNHDSRTELFLFEEYIILLTSYTENVPSIAIYMY